MSLIVYYQDALYADRSGVAHTDELSHFVEINKMFVSRDKTFAFAYTGVEFIRTDVFFKNFVRLLKRKLKEISAIEGSLTFKLPANSYAVNNALLIMTHDKVYTGKFELNEEEKTCYFVLKQLDKKLFYALGSSTRIAHFCYAAGCSIEEIYKAAAQVSECMIMSPLDTIMASQLKPLT